MFKTIGKLETKDAETNLRLLEAKTQVLDLGAADKFYPAIEVRQKLKVFVTVRRQASL
jgi:hypothetical protein